VTGDAPADPDLSARTAELAERLVAAGLPGRAALLRDAAAAVRAGGGEASRGRHRVHLLTRDAALLGDAADPAARLHADSGPRDPAEDAALLRADVRWLHDVTATAGLERYAAGFGGVLDRLDDGDPGSHPDALRELFVLTADRMGTLADTGLPPGPGRPDREELSAVLAALAARTAAYGRDVAAEPALVPPRRRWRWGR